MSTRTFVSAFAILALLASGCSDDAARSSVRKLKKENGRLADRLQKLEAQIASLKQMSAKVREVKADVEDTATSISSTRAQVQKLEASLARLKAIDGIAGDLKKLTEEIETRLSVVDSDLKQVKAAQTNRSTETDGVVSAAPKSIGKLRSQVQLSSRKINELDAKVKKLEGQKPDGGSVNEDALRKLVSDEMDKMRQGWRQRRGGQDGGQNGGRRRRNRDGGNDMNQ